MTQRASIGGAGAICTAGSRSTCNQRPESAVNPSATRPLGRGPLVDPRDGSTITQSSVWEAADPEQALARERNNPGQALGLARKQLGTRPPGARRGPSGTLAEGVALAVNTPVTRRERAPPPKRRLRSTRGRTLSSPLPIHAHAHAQQLGDGDETSTAIDVPTDLNDLLPMGVDHSPRRSDDAPRVEIEPRRRRTRARDRAVRP